MPPRRSARLAARRGPGPEPITLDDVGEACNGPTSSRHIQCCNCFAHRDCVYDGVDAICPFCRIDLRDFLEVRPKIQCPVCQGLADPQGCGSAPVPTLPQSLFHLSCLARMTPVDGRVWCHACPEDVRSGFDADWFERQCHMYVVEFPADPGCGVCTVCVEGTTVDSSVEVPCCHQRLNVICLARSFSSQGGCPFCNQSIAEFARSTSFWASSLFHGNFVDFAPEQSGEPFLWFCLLVSLVLPMI